MFTSGSAQRQPPPPPPPQRGYHQAKASVQTTISSGRPLNGPQSTKAPRPQNSFNSARAANTASAPPRPSPYRGPKTKETVVRAFNNISAFIENEPPADTAAQDTRNLQPEPSSLSALHEAVYFNEDDFESDGDLDFDDSITIIAAPSTTSFGAHPLPTGRGNLPPPPEPVSVDYHVRYAGVPTSSAPVEWSSSPAEHFARPPGTVNRDSARRPIVIDEVPEEGVGEAHQPKKRKLLPWTGKAESGEGLKAAKLTPTLHKPARSGKGQANPQYLWDMTASELKRANRRKPEQKRPYSTSSASSAPAKTAKLKQKKLKLSSEQSHVLDMVVEGGKGIFFTGSAGTGKSVLLREVIAALREKHSKEKDSIAVTASTGLAACNIGGVTLHSFAGIGLGKEPAEELIKKIHKNPKARLRWQRTKVLIIDEISMVDGDLFDKLEFIARKVRKEVLPFGGIQLVITGDFFQLPPVPVPGKVAKFAFDADSWSSSIAHTIGLTQVFRQRDPEFADILNEMRLGRLSDSSVSFFGKLARSLEYEDGIEATELFPTRQEVDAANFYKMQQIVGPSIVFEATDSGTIHEKSFRDKLLANCMAPQKIELKTHSQVMLIKNQDETLVNGSLGRVIGFMTESEFDLLQHDLESFEEALTEREHAKESIKIGDTPKRMGASSTALAYPLVQFALPDGTTRQLLVQPEVWKVELPNGEVQAQRIQLPLILAWALSIHKAQGQTLERVKVDLGKVFEKGQAYVALSRATCQEGLQVLRFDRGKVMAHEKVRAFYDSLLSAYQAKECNNLVPVRKQMGTGADNIDDEDEYQANATMRAEVC